MVAILSTRTGGRATLARAFDLDRRARHRTIGTEYATIARLRLQLRAAASAFVEEPTCIGRQVSVFVMEQCGQVIVDDALILDEQFQIARAAHILSVMAEDIGAYREDDDPSIVFVFARSWAPGGGFSALRIGGVWKPASLTFGDVEDRFTRIKAPGEVAALLKAARESLGSR